MERSTDTAVTEATWWVVPSDTERSPRDDTRRFAAETSPADDDPDKVTRLEPEGMRIEASPARSKTADTPDLAAPVAAARAGDDAAFRLLYRDM